MTEPILFTVLFCAMFVFHELSHVAYAKFVNVYKGIAIFRLYHISKKIPHKGIGMLPLGAGVETYLEKETLHQRVFNCLCGTIGGLPFLVIGWFTLSDFGVLILSVSYLICFSVDFVTVLQIAVIGRKRGWDVKLVEVV